MADINTVRILQLDGGGARGYMSLYFLKQFVDLWGIDPTTIASHFDVVCGTSAGGIIALMIAAGMTPDEILSFYTTQVPYVFSLTSLVPSVRPNLVAKLALIATDTPFYQSSGPTADQYGQGLLVATLQSIFGSTTLQNLNSNVVIPTYQYDTSTYVMFSNLNYPEFYGQNFLVSDVGLATSAAPIYFPSWTVGPHVYIDGGIYNNNVSQIGKFAALSVKPNANRSCVLSLGTGIGEMGFDPGNPDFYLADPLIEERLNKIFKLKGLPSLRELKSNNIPFAFDSIQTIFQLFDMSQAGAQESIAYGLGLEAKYTNTQSYFYRFQPELDTELNTELDNTDPEILVYYQTTAENVFESDYNNISTFLGHLTA